jgi:type I restriction enzyme S subunit
VLILLDSNRSGIKPGALHEAHLDPPPTHAPLPHPDHRPHSEDRERRGRSSGDTPHNIRISATVVLVLNEASGSPDEVGKPALWNGTIEDCCFQNTLIRVRSHGTDARFLLHIGSATLADWPVPLPPLAEQRRIVDALDDHLSRLDAAVAYMAAVEQRIARLWDSVLESVTYRPIASSGWPELPTGDVAQVQGGIQKQPKRRPVENRYPFLRVANVPRGRLALDDIHEVDLFGDELERFALRQGDLLVVEGNGSPEQIGRAAMWHGEIENCVHQNHVIRIRPDARMDARFLEYVWNAPTTARRLLAVASSTSCLHTLSTAKVKAVRVPVPPRHDQALAIAKVERWRTLVARQSATVAASQQRAAQFRRSLLQQAFSGRMVPQDPTDESASVLLDRLKAERAAAPRPARHRTRTG